LGTKFAITWSSETLFLDVTTFVKQVFLLSSIGTLQNSITQPLSLSLKNRFDNVGGASNTKVDPTFQKCQTAGETVVQILLAAASGDKLALQRYRVYK
jgi:hypothetical protein